MRCFTVVQGQLFTGFDVLPGINLYPVPKDTHKHIGPAAVVQVTKRVPSSAVQRMGVVQVDEAHAALAFGTLSRSADGYDLAGDLADLRAARDSDGCEHARSLDGAPSGFDFVFKHFV